MAGESAREEARRAREKAERLARRAEMFEKGADGEAATAALLQQLPAGWTAIHDVRWPSRRFANIDHLVIGPGGVFVIDSKNWSGHISVDNGVLRQNGRSREKSVAACADAGLAVAELAGPYTGRVAPVLCFTTAVPLTGWCRDVLVCSSSTLSHMLLSRPCVMTPAEVADAALRLDAQLRAATDRPVVASRSAVSSGGRRRIARTAPYSATRSATRSSVRSQRAKRQRRKAARQFVAALILLVVWIGYGPEIVDGLLS